MKVEPFERFTTAVWTLRFPNRVQRAFGIFAVSCLSSSGSGCRSRRPRRAAGRASWPRRGAYPGLGEATHSCTMAGCSPASCHPGRPGISTVSGVPVSGSCSSSGVGDRAVSVDRLPERDVALRARDTPLAVAWAGFDLFEALALAAHRGGDSAAFGLRSRFRLGRRHGACSATPGSTWSRRNPAASSGGLCSSPWWESFRSLLSASGSPSRSGRGGRRYRRGRSGLGS